MRASIWPSGLGRWTIRASSVDASLPPPPRRYIVASPAYLAQHAAPTTIADLQAHRIISGRSPGVDIWTLRDKAGGETSVKLEARLVATSTEGLMATVVAGFGLAMASAFACRAELERGDLVRVLADYQLATIDVHAVSPLGRKPPAKARLFIDHMVDTMAGISERELTPASFPLNVSKRNSKAQGPLKDA